MAATIGVEDRDALDPLRSPAISTCLLDLPPAILSHILSFLSNPLDAIAASFSCHFLANVVASCPLHIVLPVDEISKGEVKCVRASSRFFATEIESWEGWLLAMIRGHLSSTVFLDAFGFPLTASNLRLLLRDLKSLEVLLLDSCQKLSAEAADVITTSLQSGPQVVSLQRCYVSRLRVLALQNFSGFSISLLSALAAVCPSLELLFLGGSGESLRNGYPPPPPPAAAAARGTIQAAVDDSQEGEGPTAAAQVWAAIAGMKSLALLELTFFDKVLIRGLRAMAEVAYTSRGVHSSSSGNLLVLDFEEEASIACGVAIAEALDDHLSSPSDRLLHQRGSLPVLLAGCSCDTSDNGGDWKNIYIPPAVEKWKAWGWAERRGIVLALRAAANCSGPRRRTPLHTAALKGTRDSTAGLLSLGAVVVASSVSGGAAIVGDAAGRTALFLAAEMGRLDVIDLLLRGGADPLARTRAGECPLYLAALKGHRDAVDLMLQHCAAKGLASWTDGSTYEDGWTPLMAAAVADRRAVADCLLQHAESASLVDDTALTLPGALPSIDDSAKKSERMDGCSSSGRFSGAEDSARQPCPSVDRHPPPLVTNEFGGVQDVSRKHVMSDVLKKLINAQNRYGQTALHIASRQGFVWFVEKLLESGADAAIEDSYQRTAEDTARQHGQVKVLQLLSRDTDGQPCQSTRASGKKERRRRWRVTR